MTSVKSSSSYKRREGTGQDWWAALFVSSVHFVLCTSHGVMSPPKCELGFLQTCDTLNPNLFKLPTGVI